MLKFIILFREYINKSKKDLIKNKNENKEFSVIVDGVCISN